MRESEFDDRDRATLLADYSEEHQPRTQLGVLVSDALDKDAAWNVDVLYDHAAAAVDRKRDEYKRAYPDADLGAYRFVPSRVN